MKNLSKTLKILAMKIIKKLCLIKAFKNEIKKEILKNLDEAILEENNNIIKPLNNIISSNNEIKNVSSKKKNDILKEKKQNKPTKKQWKRR